MKRAFVLNESGMLVAAGESAKVHEKAAALAASSIGRKYTVYEEGVSYVGKASVETSSPEDVQVHDSQK